MPKTPLGKFQARTESILAQPEVCQTALSDTEAAGEAADALLNDPEAQKLQDILSQLGFTINTNDTTGCIVDEEMISDDGDTVASQGVFSMQTTPTGPIYTQTAVGSNGALHMVEGANEEDNLWLSWQQDSTNSLRKRITHIELFGDNSALDAALAQNMALGVRFSTMDDYNKRRLIHELSQYTNLNAQVAAGAQSTSDGLPIIEALQFGGQLLDVKNAQAVVVNEFISPTNSSILIGEALIVLPLISNSRGAGGINFELDDALYLRIPVFADINEPLWQVAFAGAQLPDPLDEPRSIYQIEKLPPNNFGFAIRPLFNTNTNTWRTGRFEIQVTGHPSWTTPREFSIVLGLHAGTSGTSQFNNILEVNVDPSSTSTIVQNSATIPLMNGTVINERVNYEVYVQDSKGVIFEFRLDMNEDDFLGIEDNYAAFPVFYEDTTGNSYEVMHKPGNALKFALRTPSDDHLLPLTNVQACSSDLTNCASETVYDHTVAEFETTILDPNILDYWSTPLVVPKDYSLTTEAIGDINRNNFYKNYTTERVDALDIRAFARWGYDFESAFDYCPYTYYDELKPFKRVLCEGYWSIWYQKQWEKENAMEKVIQSVNIATQQGLNSVLYAEEFAVHDEVLLQGYTDLNVERVKTLVASSAVIETNGLNSNQHAMGVFDAIDSAAMTSWMEALAQAEIDGNVDEVYEQLLSTGMNELEESVLSLLSTADPTDAKQVILDSQSPDIFCLQESVDGQQLDGEPGSLHEGIDPHGLNLPLSEGAMSLDLMDVPFNRPDLAFLYQGLRAKLEQIFISMHGIDVGCRIVTCFRVHLIDAYYEFTRFGTALAEVSEHTWWVNTRFEEFLLEMDSLLDQLIVEIPDFNPVTLRTLRQRMATIEAIGLMSWDPDWMVVDLNRRICNDGTSDFLEANPSYSDLRVDIVAYNVSIDDRMIAYVNMEIGSIESRNVQTDILEPLNKSIEHIHQEPVVMVNNLQPEYNILGYVFVDAQNNLQMQNLLREMADTNIDSSIPVFVAYTEDNPARTKHIVC